MSVAGCGKKAENTNTTPQQTAQSDASGAYENGSATETLDGQDYSKNVDMASVEGTEAITIKLFFIFTYPFFKKQFCRKDM